MPYSLKSKDETSFSNSEIIGIFRCVPRRNDLGFSLNDYLSITDKCKLFSLVEYEDNSVSVRLFLVRINNTVITFEPVQFDLYPQFPQADKNGNKVEKSK